MPWSPVFFVNETNNVLLTVCIKLLSQPCCQYPILNKVSTCCWSFAVITAVCMWSEVGSWIIYKPRAAAYTLRGSSDSLDTCQSWTPLSASWGMSFLLAATCLGLIAESVIWKYVNFLHFNLTKISGVLLNLSMLIPEQSLLYNQIHY
jgi:hypothetical protein